MLSTPAYRTSRWPSCRPLIVWWRAMRHAPPLARWRGLSVALMLLCVCLLYWTTGNDTRRLHSASPSLSDRVGGTSISDVVRERDSRAALASMQEELDRALSEQALLKARVAELESSSSLPPQPKQQEHSGIPVLLERHTNTLGLPPFLSPVCNDPDTILFHRYALARQRAFLETEEQTNSGLPVRNPDPDLYCLDAKLLIDSTTHVYSWSEEDARLEQIRQATAASEGAETMQRFQQQAQQPEVVLPFTPVRVSRESGFGIAAQLHIIAARMLYAWQHGMVYVNVGRTLWTKGVPRQPAPPWPPRAREPNSAWQPQAAPIPFRSDVIYNPSDKSTLPPGVSLQQHACEDGSWDCFFLPWTSPACSARARKLRKIFADYPPLTELNRKRVRELEKEHNVLFNPDLSHFLQSKTFTNPAGLETMRSAWEATFGPGVSEESKASSTLLESLPREFDFDSTKGPWANPWALPGLQLTSTFSSARGDLFLVSELVRFIARPNPYLQRHIRKLAQEMRFPGISAVPMIGARVASSTPAGAGAVLEPGSRASPSAASTNVAPAPVVVDDFLADDSDRDASSSTVLSIHVRRNTGSMSSGSSLYVPVHKSAEYVLFASRLASSMGFSAAFISTDDVGKVEGYKDSLGAGSVGIGDGHGGTPGLGMHVMHIPLRMVGASAAGVGATSGAASVGMTGQSARAAAALAASLLLDEEGATLLASLFLMGVMSGHTIGTLSSHWGRLVYEMSRWDEGSCRAAPRGWIMPLGRRSSPLASLYPSRTPGFTDLDGDVYFIGDFRSVRHPRLSVFDPRAMDPTVEDPHKAERREHAERERVAAAAEAEGKMVLVKVSG